MPDRDDEIAKLEKLGERRVREKALRNEFGSVGTTRRQIVDEWLEMRASRTLSNTRFAAWVAAVAAVTSVVISLAIAIHGS